MIYCQPPFHAELAQLLARFSLKLCLAPNQQDIPGSFWGDSEAGLIADELWIREDTPLHSALHEACHYICMSIERRKGLDTDAGGDYDEENGVCYLQIVLAGHLSFSSGEQMMRDMDEWGYTFRLGSAKHWFLHDALDAKQWLIEQAIISENSQPLWQLRTSSDNQIKLQA